MTEPITRFQRLKHWFSQNRGVVFLFLVALLIRVLYVNVVYDEPKFYRWMSAHIDNRALGVIFGERVFFITSWASYHLPLAGLYKILQWLGLLDQRMYIGTLVNSLYASFSIVLVYMLARHLYGHVSRWLVWSVTLLYFFYYPYMYFTAVNTSENWFTPLFILAIYLQVRFANRLDWRFALLNGVILGLAAIIRPIVLPFLPFFFTWLLWHHRHFWKQWLAQYLPAFVGGLLTVLISTSALNAVYDDKHTFHFTGNGGANVAFAWCDMKGVQYSLENGERMGYFHPSRHEQNNLVFVQTNEPFTHQGYYYRMGLNCLKENPQKLFHNFKHIVGLVKSKFYPDFIDAEWHRVLLNEWRLITVMLVFGFVAFPLVSTVGPAFWTLGLAVLLSLCLNMYAASTGEERYLIPYYFVLAVWGLPGLFFAGKKVSTFSLKTWAAILLVAIVAWFSVPPVYQQIMAHQQKARYFEAFHHMTLWLVNNQRPDGGFDYEVRVDNPPGVFDKIDNMPRQLTASQGVANAARYFPEDKAIQQGHRKNLAFLLRHIKWIDSKTAYVIMGPDNPMGHLGTNGLAALTLIDSPDAAKYEKEIKGLGEFLLFMQQPNGKFYMRYPLALNAQMTPQEELGNQQFSAGQASVACIWLYKHLKDERYLDCARKDFKYYYPRLQYDTFNRFYFSWQGLTYSQLYQVDPRPEYLAATNQFAQEFVNRQTKASLNPKEYIGGFYNAEDAHTSSAAVYAELLGQAYRANLMAGNLEQAKVFKESQELAFEYILSFMYGMNNDPRLAGGIQSHQEVRRIRIDNNGHMLVTFKEYFGREEALSHVLKR